MLAKMRNGGAACTAANRIYVQRKVAAEFTQKFAAAMGAFVGAAQAQSSVSVYGIYDGGFNSTNTETNTAGVISKAITNGWIGGSAASSRLGFRGTEDVGGGTAVGFVLEYGLKDIAIGGTGGAQKYVTSINFR